MGAGPSQERPGTPSPGATDATRSADELEQRQRADGSLEDPGVAEGDLSEPHPDVVEQRQRMDGTVTSNAVDEPTEEPLDADRIEQRRIVEDDELDDEGWEGTATDEDEGL